jgi:hypothetical protein
MAVGHANVRDTRMGKVRVDELVVGKLTILKH